MVVIVCWICNQAFVHNRRGRRPDACPECREGFTDKEYEKFRAFHKIDQESYEDYNEEPEDYSGNSGDYSLTNYDDNFQESVNIEHKPRYAYTQHRNQHGKPKKSHWSKLFKDSQARTKTGRPAPASYRATHEVFCRSNGLEVYPVYDEESIYEIPRGYIPTGTVSKAFDIFIGVSDTYLGAYYKSWISRDCVVDKHWNLGPWSPKKVQGALAGERTIPDPKINPIKYVDWYHHDKEKQLLDKKRIKRMKKLQPWRKYEDVKFSKRPCSPVFVTEKKQEAQLHNEKINFYYATYLGVCIFDRVVHERKQHHSFYHVKLPGWVYTHIYNAEGRLIDHPKKISTRIKNIGDEFWCPYFSVSNKVKRGTQYEREKSPRKGKFNIPRKYIYEDAEIGKKIAVPGSEREGARSVKVKYHKEDRAPFEPCPLCDSKEFTWVITKTPGEDKWGNKYSWKYTGKVYCCSKCGYVVEKLPHSLYY